MPQTAEANLDTEADKELNGVEIFRAGTYHLSKADGTKEVLNYSEADVEQIAENANALLAAKKHEPPYKLGHDDDQMLAKMAGHPSIGWVKRVVARGGRLFADFKQVPAAIASAIEKGRYKYISSEIYDPKQTAENFGDFVKGFSLRAVALLGADVPVVKGMNPVMLFSRGEGFVTLTIQREETVSRNFSEDGKKPLMVPANRHPYGALVKMAGDDKDAGPKKVHEVHPDGTYDVHDLHNPGKVHKAVHHDDLALLSEREYRAATAAQETNMAETEAVKLAEQKRVDAESALLAEKKKTAELLAKITDDKISAFAEKHKSLLKQPPILAAFKALAKSEVSAPIKLAEGKEQPFLEAFMAFAESLISSKPVLFGELAPVVKEGGVEKTHAVKMAEEQFRGYAETHGSPSIRHAGVAVSARQKFSESEGKKVSFKTVLLAEAAKFLKYNRATHQYDEVTPEAA